MTRRNRIVVGVMTAVAASVVVAVPAGAGGDAVSADLGSNAAKRGTLTLDLTGTAGSDSITVATLAGGVRVSVPAPATIDGPDECTEDNPQQFTCDASIGVEAVRGFMGPGGDRFNAKQLKRLTNQYGGSGNDTLLGGKKFDFLNGQGGGNDRCRGRRGNETLKKCE